MPIPALLVAAGLAAAGYTLLSDSKDEKTPQQGRVPVSDEYINQLQRNGHKIKTAEEYLNEQSAKSLKKIPISELPPNVRARVKSV